MNHDSFSLDPDYENRLRSVLAIASAILNLEDVVVDVHKKRLLKDFCLWRLTTAEAKGEKKYNLRYVSERARPWIGMPKRKRGEPIRHDHVFCRAKMYKDIDQRPDNAKLILQLAVGCVVTDDEHRKLGKHKETDGWERYKRAGIAVYDRLKKEPASIDTLIAESEEKLAMLKE